MPQEVLQSLGYLNNYLANEIVKRKKEELESNVNLAAKHAIQNMMSLSPDATISDVQNATFKSMGEAATLNVFPQVAQTLSSLYSARLPLAQKVEQLKRYEELKPYISQALPGLGISKAPSEIVPFLTDFYSKGIRTINYMDDKGRDGQAVVNIFSPGDKFEPYKSITYGPTAKEKQNIELQKAYLSSYYKELGKVSAKGMGGNTGNEIKPSDIRQNQQQAYTTGNNIAKNILLSSGLDNYTTGSDNFNPNSGDFYNSSYQTLQSILMDPNEAKKLAESMDPNGKAVMVKWGKSPGGQTPNGKTLPNVTYVPENPAKRRLFQDFMDEVDAYDRYNNSLIQGSFAGTETNSGIAQGNSIDIENKIMQDVEPKIKQLLNTADKDNMYKQSLLVMMRALTNNQYLTDFTADDWDKLDRRTKLAAISFIMKAKGK